MNEAKFSINIKYNWRGYDSQITLRSDTQLEELLQQAHQAITRIEHMGATGERRWEAAKDNGHGKETAAPPQPKSDEHTAGPERRPATPAPPPAPPKGAKPTGIIEVDEVTPCPLCADVGQLELIGFTRGGAYRQAWKCQACGKWLPEPKS